MHSVGTVPVVKMHPVGTIPKGKMHHVDPVPRFQMYPEGTVIKLMFTNFEGTVPLKTSPPNARVAAMTSMRTNNFKTLRLTNTLESFSKHF